MLWRQRENSLAGSPSTRLMEVVENMDDASSTSSLVCVVESSASSGSDECCEEEYDGGPDRSDFLPGESDSERQTWPPQQQTHSRGALIGRHRCYIRYNQMKWLFKFI